MKHVFAGLLLAAAIASSGCSSMGMSATMRVQSAPPPPTMAFDSDPHFNFLSNHQVSVIADDSFGYDMFSSGGNYYLYDSGYWYRSESPRGQFVSVEVNTVPKPIFDVNDGEYRWRRHPDGWRAGQQNGDNNNHPDSPGH
jgi:hypothetical protein